MGFKLGLGFSCLVRRSGLEFPPTSLYLDGRRFQQPRGGKWRLGSTLSSLPCWEPEMRIKIASLYIRAWITKAGEGNWKLTSEQTKRADENHHCAVGKGPFQWSRTPNICIVEKKSTQTIHCIHLSLIHMALEWQAVAENRDVSLLDPRGAPSHTQNHQRQLHLQLLGESLPFPLGEHSPNLGVTQVTLQEGAFSQIKFSRRWSDLQPGFLLFPLVTKIQIFCKNSYAIKDIGFASLTFYHSLGNLILKTFGGWSQTGSWKKSEEPYSVNTVWASVRGGCQVSSS